MGRQAVGAVVAVLTASIVTQLIAHAGAIPESALHASLVVIFWLLKAAAASAVAYLLLGRSAAREPLVFAASAAAILGVLALRPETSAPAGFLVVGVAVAVIAGVWMLTSLRADAHGSPVRLGVFAMVVGLLLAAPSVWNAMGVMVLMAGQLIASRLERRALARTFPQYRTQTARISRRLPRRAMSRALETGVDVHRMAAAGAVALGVVALFASQAALAASAP
jgi:hypothetical protein